MFDFYIVFEEEGQLVTQTAIQTKTVGKTASATQGLSIRYIPWSPTSDILGGCVFPILKELCCYEKMHLFKVALYFTEMKQKIQNLCKR